MSRIDELERRMAEVETRLDALERENSGPAVEGRDRYDRRVIKKLQNTDGEVQITTLYSFYRQAGVRNESKIKSRLRDLASDGLIEKAGSSRWRFVGPEQGRLGGVQT